MPKPKPTASGSLEATPMANLMVYALDKRLTGTIVFDAPGAGRSAVYFEEGVPGKAKTADPVIHLGRLLLELGAIDDVTQNRTLVRCAKEKRLHGLILLEEGAIDENVLQDALREQLTRKLLTLFELPPNAVYGFYEKTNFLERWGAPESVPIEPLAVIWRGIRAHEDATRIETALARLGGRELRLHAQAQLSRFCFSSRDWAVLEVVRAKPQSLAALLASGVADDATIKRMIYALVVTRSLDLGAGTRPVGATAGQQSIHPRAQAKTQPRVQATPSSARRTASDPISGERSVGEAVPQAVAASARRPPPMPARGAPSSPRAAPPPVAGPRTSDPMAARARVARPPDSSPVSSHTPINVMTPSPVSVREVADARSGAAPLPPIGTPKPRVQRPVSDSSPPSVQTHQSEATLRSNVPDTGVERRPVKVEVVAPSSPENSPPPAPKPSPSMAPSAADVAEFKQQILARSQEIGSQSYYEILGVPRDAPSAAIAAAFFKLAKKWHPDRLGADYEEVRTEAVSVFARMNEAHQVLTDDERRAEYDAVLEDGGGSAEEQEQVQAVVRAITEYQKAEVLYKKHAIEQAEFHARRAMEDDPGQADYVALYTLIAAERRGNGRMDDLIALLDGALRREPANERARFTRGQIYKRLARMDLAIKDFRWVAEQNPRNLEAAREVRLYTMRHGGASDGPKSSRKGGKPAQESGGLFGKLFKR